MALSGFGRGQRLLGRAEGLGTTLVVIVFIAAVVYASSRPTLRERFDLTEGATYTLEEQTRSILGALEVPVTVTTLFRPEPQAIPNGLAEAQARAASYVRNLLEEYVVAGGGRFSVRHLDPHADRPEVEGLINRLHITRYNVVIVEAEDRTRQVYLEDLVTIDRGFADPQRIEPAELRQYHGEGPLTSAVLSVADDAPPRIAQLVGWDEPSLTDFDLFGLGLLSESLRGQGFEIEPVELEGQRLPEGFDIVAVLGPRRPLSDAAIAALRAHHRAGGGLFLALEPTVRDDGLEVLLSELGLRREHRVATRDDVPFEGLRRAVIPVRRFRAEHAITAPIAKRGVFANFPAAGHVDRTTDADPTLRTTSLVLTESNVWGDVWPGPEEPGNAHFDDGLEVRAERTLGVAVEGGPGRVVCFGGAGFLGNSYLGSAEGGPGNMDLALNAMNWLAEREEAVASRPRDVFESRVDMTEDERWSVYLYVVVFMPLAGVLLGLVVWFVRRR